MKYQGLWIDGFWSGLTKRNFPKRQYSRWSRVVGTTVGGGGHTNYLEQTFLVTYNMMCMYVIGCFPRVNRFPQLLEVTVTVGIRTNFVSALPYPPTPCPWLWYVSVVSVVCVWCDMRQYIPTYFFAPTMNNRYIGNCKFIHHETISTMLHLSDLY